LSWKEEKDSLTIQVHVLRGEKQTWKSEAVDEISTMTFVKGRPTLDILISPKDPFTAALCRDPQWEKAHQMRITFAPEQLCLSKAEKNQDDLEWCEQRDPDRAQQAAVHYLSMLWRVQSILHHPNTFDTKTLHEIIHFGEAQGRPLDDRQIPFSEVLQDQEEGGALPTSPAEHSMPNFPESWQSSPHLDKNSAPVDATTIPRLSSKLNPNYVQLLGDRCPSAMVQEMAFLGAAAKLRETVADRPFPCDASPAAPAGRDQYSQQNAVGNE
jgi:hypothetical protein